MLVDTHVIIWLADDDGRLGRRARELLESRYPVYYSAMSVFEMVVKSMRGGARTPAKTSDHIDRLGLRQLPLVGEHAELLRESPELARHDPFDRALVAQARAERLDLLTADRALLQLDLPWIVDART